MKLIFFEKIDSTNTYAKLNIDDLEDKSVVYTNFQTRGRGRFDRSWVNLGSENIYMTIILKPSEKFEQNYSNLTQYLSLCLCKQLKEPGLTPQIKWPNDVLVNGKKIAGILAETVIKGGNLKGIALGIGVNLNADLQDVLNIDRPATSLNLELGKNIDKPKFMKKLLEEFFESYDDFLKHGFKFIKEDYEKRACFLGQNLKVVIFDIIKEGYCKGLDDFGNLILTDKNGHEQSINMGEIIE
ncbi:MAG TPA: biotin--[acetyl-CoA-carboxylase] ligase [Candidatus Gastranaerophilaceae bacterium]|nr:biotin--[acetyl-CoA-carboxylase] ligase [Candidatus Gastranaerophilaceae bacterium]HPT42064.1 biotin--[acetyl-CoA-carboxylase] ligase [Candidatus Gastranaerophilaceae bacterium]